jgi:hypothetical protein
MYKVNSSLHSLSEIWPYVADIWYSTTKKCRVMDDEKGKTAIKQVCDMEPHYMNNVYMGWKWPINDT